MANILINGLKSKTGGGKSILSNYLSLLTQSNTQHNYYVLTPDREQYKQYASDSVQIIKIPNLFAKNALFPLLYAFVLPRVLRSYNIDVIFNLGDIAIPSKIPQVYLFDWPYAAYPDSIVWNRMDPVSFLTRRIKLFFFKKYIRYATVVIAQTETMKQKLQVIYGLKKIHVVPNAVSLENMDGGQAVDFKLPDEKKKFLYLSYYYPHKNIEVFLPLARLIKENALPYCLVVTIGVDQHKCARKFLDTVHEEGLDDIIVNVGPVPMSAVPSLYAQCDALLMPTLLESYGLPYVEAMFNQRTILTSDLDFATDVCGEAAFYFDPLDPNSILASINRAYENENLSSLKIEEGNKRIRELLTWEQVVRRYQEIIENTI